MKDGYNRFLVTREALSLLKRRLENAHTDFAAAGKQLGFAADGEEHDNAAFDYAQWDYSEKKVGLADLIAINKFATILEPRYETNTIGVGNTVRILYKGENDEETYTIAGFIDVLMGIRGRVSFESSLGQALLGLSVGNEKVFDVTEKASGRQFQNKIKVVAIYPGQF